jgi:hypothetical protein
MNKLKYLLLTVFLASTFFACENVDFGDINDNQNGSEEPATSGLLSGSIMTYATFTNRTGLTIPTLLVQYQSQVTYTDEMLYAETPYSWTTYYTALVGLTKIIEITSDPSQVTPEVILQGDPVNQQGVATIMRAVIMKRVTDVYGEAPFKEAFKGLGDITPAYDTQEDIYKTLISQVKAGRNMLDATKAAGKGDILYSGSISRWKKLANSLLLQLSIQLSKKYPAASGYAATEFNAALAHADGTIENIADEAWLKYQDLVGFRNPWFANRTADYFLSREFTDALKGNATANNRTTNHTFDNRLRVYARSTSNNGVPYGFRNGSGTGAAQMNRIYYWNATSPLPLMTASYTFLNRAEAAALGWTGENAAFMLEQGILKSYESLQNITAVNNAPLATLTDGTAYAAARIVDVATAPGGIRQIIGEEKWVSLYGQAFDSWAEWRRTGYPNLLPATDFLNNGKIPRRFLYPREEPSLNGANYTAAVGRLQPGEDDNTAKVWWDQ